VKTHSTKGGVQFESGPYLTGSVLVGVGGLIAFIGVLIGALHALSQGMHWLESLETPPSEMAKMRWTQAKAAGLAGAEAWKKNAGPSSISALD
jgi:hypothetical protein